MEEKLGLPGMPSAHCEDKSIVRRSVYLRKFRGMYSISDAYKCAKQSYRKVLAWCPFYHKCDKMCIV